MNNVDHQNTSGASGMNDFHTGQILYLHVTKTEQIYYFHVTEFSNNLKKNVLY